MFVEIFIELLVYSGGLHNKLVFPHKNERWEEITIWWSTFVVYSSQRAKTCCSGVVYDKFRLIESRHGNSRNCIAINNLSHTAIDL